MTESGSGPDTRPAAPPMVRARRIGVDTRQEAVVLLPQDSPVSHAEGFTAHSRVQLSHGTRSVIATLYEVMGDFLGPGEAGLSESAWHLLGLADRGEIAISHPRPLVSLSLVRSKVFGRPLDAAAFREIVADIVAGRYSDIHLAALVTALAARPLDRAEMEAMTGAMVAAGDARAVITDGRQPVGRGIGPALEALDVLAVLQNAPGAPADLRDRAVRLAGALLELSGRSAAGAGTADAAAILADGRAWDRFQRICEAQGGIRIPPVAPHRHPVAAGQAGRVAAIDNRRLANVAKLAGAPESKAAGVEMAVRLGDRVAPGQPLYAVHAETPGELAYALDYVAAAGEIVRIAD